MIPISVHSERLLNKMKNAKLVDRSATRVIIDINPEDEWVQLYVCEGGASKADAALALIERLVGKFGDAPGSKKSAKPAKKDEAKKLPSSPDNVRGRESGTERHALKG